MKKYIVFCVILCITVISSPTSVPAPFKQDKSAKYWVFFKDKDTSLLLKARSSNNIQRTLLSERSLTRRAKAKIEPIQASDLPVSLKYLDALSSAGFRPVTISRWLNAATFYLTKHQADSLQSIPFITAVRPAEHWKSAPPKPATVLSLPKLDTKDKSSIYYGYSLTQNRLTGTLELHKAGITGKGVLIGMLDTGFNTNHESFEHTTIIAAYDFINKDTVVSNQSGQDAVDQEYHGSETLSTIAGYRERYLIGTAYNAQFALAKTEVTPSETSIEEDYWVAGIEWLDSVGVDIVSSSLGYTTFSDTSYYTPADMDGNTALTTIAADIAASKGILVIVSAGNEGNDSWYIIGAPADGDSVLAVGAIDINGIIASFSSHGPTADGRIKPDVVAQGVYVFTVTPGYYDSYWYLSGTSFACPLTAGAAALILSAHPELTPMQIINAFKQTASQHNNPDNTYGWGLINALSAATYYGPVFSNEPDVTYSSSGSLIKTCILSTVGLDSTSLTLYYATAPFSNYTPLPLTVTSNPSEFSALIPISQHGTFVKLYFSARDRSGNTTTFPNLSLRQPFTLTTGDSSTHINPIIPTELTLSHNYPNPFNSSTTFTLTLAYRAHVRITIYDALGRKVKILFSDMLGQGTYPFRWEGTADSGASVASGIYFYQAIVGSRSITKKMMLIR